MLKRPINLHSKEIFAGLTTFFTMSYIVILNPLIWSTNGTGVSLAFALNATVMILFLVNMLSCFLVKLPYAFGPGMGLNAFVVYTVILSEKIPFETALGVVFWSSVLFISISVLPVRQKIIEALPENMKHAMSCGIGFFLAFIGFKNLNLVVINQATMLSLGNIDLKLVLGLIGFFVAFFLFHKKKSYAFLFSILFVTFLSVMTGTSSLPDKWVAKPDFSTIFPKVDIWGAFKLSLAPTVLSLFITNLFDSISTIIGLSSSSGMLDTKGNPVRLKQILVVDSLGSLTSSFIGTSPTAVYIESAAGIQAGGRTGIVPLVVALCFLPCLFLEPFVKSIPTYATAPILIFVGILMSLNLKHIKYDGYDDIIPIFITITLMPLTSSITYGVSFGLLTFVIVKTLSRKTFQITPTLWILSAVCLISLIGEKTNLLHFK